MKRQISQALTASILLHILIVGLPYWLFVINNPSSGVINFALLEPKEQKPRGTQVRGSQQSVRVPQKVKTESLPSISAPSAPTVTDAKLQSTASELHSYTDQLIQTNAAPEYPQVSRIRREEGQVKVRVTLESHTKTVSLEESSGFRLLDEASITAVQRWNFPPFPEKEKVVILIPFEFSLQKAALNR